MYHLRFLQVQKQPIMIVMELVSGGSLLSFLRNNGTSLTSKNLLGREIAYLFSNNFGKTNDGIGKNVI